MKPIIYVVPFRQVFALVAFAAVSVAQASDAVVTSFFEHLKEKRYENASKLLDDEIRTQFSEPKLRGFIKECETGDLDWTKRDSGTAGELQSIDPPLRKELPGGPIWESVLRFKNAMLPVRVAVNDDDKIAALEFYAPSEGAVPENGLRCAGGSLFAQRFCCDYSLLVEVLDPVGEPLQPKAYFNYDIGLYRQVERMPDDEPSRCWTDPADGTHWIRYNNRSEYADYNETRWEENVLRLRAMEKGTYRVTINLVNTKDRPKGNIFTPPVTFDGTDKERKITAQMVRGGPIRVRIVDAETGKPIDKASMNIENKSVPPLSLRGTWSKQDDVHLYEFAFPGRYAIAPSCYDYQPDDSVYTPEGEYETTIANGEESEIVAKLRGRSHTAEELETRWPFIISGTVRDADGKPLEQAKVTVRRNDIFVSGRWPSTSTTTDSDGKFLLRFNPDDLDSIRVMRREPPTPEKPQCMGIRIEAEKTGFIWHGIQAADGTIQGAFFDTDGKRDDRWNLVCIDPMPSDPENVVYWNTKKKLSADEIVVAKNPKELNIVLKPSILFRGVVLDDERDPVPGLHSEKASPPYLQPEPPKGKQPSHTENFYVKDFSSKNPCHFEIDVAPNEKSYVFFVRNSGFTKDDNTQWIGVTDYFSLPSAGVYDIVLRWTSTEKNGVKLRRIVIESIKDGNGNSVALNVTKKAETPERLFLHWTLSGIVRDDLGNPLEGAEVRLHRGRSTEQTVTTTDDGKYSFKILASRQPSENGEFVSIKVSKDGFFERNLNQNNLAFLSDEKNPSEKTFVYEKTETSQWVPPLGSLMQVVVLNRNPTIEGILLDDFDKPLAGYHLSLRTDAVERFDRDTPTDTDQINTDKNGKFRIEKLPADVKFWVALNERNENSKDDILRTHNLVFSPGATYRIGLRLQKYFPDIRKLVLESVTDTDGKDLSSQIVSEDVRMRPLLDGGKEKYGRKLLEEMSRQITPMLRTMKRNVTSLSYTFHLGDKPTEFTVNPYSGNMFASERVGITRSAILQAICDSTGTVGFRNIEMKDDEIRLFTNLEGRYAVGNGVTNSWNGYAGGRFFEAQIVLDALTHLPKRIKADGFEEEYHDFVAFNGGFVPLRITSKAGSMEFDFRFKIHEPGVWLFDHAVRDGKTVCRIDNVRIERRKPNEHESKVREALRKVSTVGEYWLTWYPQDQPKFSYTFHRKGAAPEKLTYKEIKAADNWYAEFYRKGISYIGVSRLLLIDIDGVQCDSVSEDGNLLTFEFELSNEWMNAVGNGISGTWLGWFNGTVGKGTAIIDTKTSTLVEVKTKFYDERYSDYFEIKPGKFVPRRIVIDYHKGNRDAESEMFFDFRFKVYEPCLWLFDRSVVKDNDPPVYIDDVLVNGEPGVEIETN